MRKFLTTITSMAMLLGSSVAYAQQSGDYGKGTLMNVDITSLNTKVDANKAQVTGISISTNDILTVANVDGSFAYNDLILVVQMEGGTIGLYEMIRVNSYNGSNQLTVQGNLMFGVNYSTSGTDKLQIIKVNEYSNLTIKTGASVTCDAYDHSTGTGGIVVFMVDNVLSFEGTGYIDIAQKGYTQNVDGGTGGAGAPGTSGGPGTSSGTGYHGGDAAGNMGQYGDKIYPYNDCSNPYSTPFSGGPGGGPDNNYTYGSSGLPGSNYGIGTPRDMTGAGFGYIIMGNSGAGGDGGRGASGGGGGGAGGGDGTSGGGNGSSGGAGEGTADGKCDGGNGGVGGGFAYIIADDIDLTNHTGTYAIYANGGDAYDGVAGGQGGQGGDGGDGAAGLCSATPRATAGGGGYGWRGDGGDGGNGGTGGDAGTIWIVYSTGNDITMSDVEGAGGDAGNGGVAGPVYPISASNGSSTNVDLNSCGQYTGPSFTAGYRYCSSTVYAEVCDCNKVFRAIALADNDGGTVSGIPTQRTVTSGTYGTITFYNPNAGDKRLVWADPSPANVGESSTTRGITLYTTYTCDIDDTYNGDCQQAVDNIFNQLHNSSSTLSPYNYNADNTPPGTYTYNPSTKVITGGSKTCTANACECTGDCPSEGSPGVSGSTGTDANAGNGKFHSTNECNQPCKRGSTNGVNDMVVDIHLFIYPNPAGSVVNLFYISPTDAVTDIVVTDMNGKEVIRKQVEDKVGESKLALNVSELASGTYIVTLTQHDRSAQIKFVVE